MEKVKQYSCVSGYEDTFANEVQKAIGNEWQPFGAVSVAVWMQLIPNSMPPTQKPVYYFSQAMVKY